MRYELGRMDGWGREGDDLREDGKIRRLQPCFWSSYWWCWWLRVFDCQVETDYGRRYSNYQWGTNEGLPFFLKWKLMGPLIRGFCFYLSPLIDLSELVCYSVLQGNVVWSVVYVWIPSRWSLAAFVVGARESHRGRIPMFSLRMLNVYLLWEGGPIASKDWGFRITFLFTSGSKSV